MAEINAQTTDDSGTIDANEALILGAIDISLNRTRLFSLHIFFLLQLLWFAFLLVCLSLPIIFNFYFSCLSLFFSPFGNRKCGRFDFDFFRGLTLASPEYLQQINFPVTWFQARFCKCKYIKKTKTFRYTNNNIKQQNENSENNYSPNEQNKSNQKQTK